MTPRAVTLVLYLAALASGCLRVGQINECGCAPEIPYLSKNAAMLLDYPNLVDNFTHYTFHRLHNQFVNNCTEVWMTCDNATTDQYVSIIKSGNDSLIGYFEPQGYSYYYLRNMTCNKTTYEWIHPYESYSNYLSWWLFGCGRPNSA